ncbi:Nitrogen assimilation regulatory protein NtrX [Methylophaga frappieri]|uniref:Nitrogen assimilation regulatory protein NtrX n=1 Tax=Methylophaga frappieri (strain ATCC BAA-2434 / DSM 25690 / JAM7) TaxID=754477 RepID=I1YJJ2_METFJ|nr:sigma-54 dependent transcriptional regulator [Methylophaga frappieri]AFJ03085.1 Nitrogen assimilation regulatory protein NtrX [Methylophaga frappieri]
MSTEKPLILVVDDEPDIRHLIRDILEDEAYRVTVASNGEEAREAFINHQPQLILLDIWMPDIDGISLLKEFKQQNSQISVIMMSGHGTIETAVEATRFGACDFIEKPLSMAKLLRGVEMALENRAKQVAQQMEQAVDPVGKSAKMVQLREQVEKIAGHDMPILLFGEGGTGKHCFAHYLHQMGNYANGKFIEFSPESFPLDSEKLVSLAQQNCVYINDIALLSDEAQTLLRHMLESGRLQQTQLICATQQSLEKAIQRGDFLEGLYYQLNTITLMLPPLREHVEDIPELVHFFVDQQTAQSGMPYRRFTVAAQNRLRNYNWPGNVTELKNVIQRMLLLGDEDDIDVEDIEAALQADPEPAADDIEGINLDLPLREAREQFERIYLLQKLQETNGNVGKAAKLAGMERTHLYRKLRSLGIDTKQL